MNLLFAILSSNAFATNVKLSSRDVKPKSYIVLLKDSSNINTKLHLSRVNTLYAKEEAPLEVKHVYTYLNGYNAIMSSDVAEQIKRLSDVDHIEEDGYVYASDSQKDAPWGLARSSSRSVLNDKGPYNYNYNATAGEGVNVYVLDTGINTSHDEFEGRAIFLENFSTSDNDDGTGHGTHCAGSIGGKNYGIAKKASIFGVKALGDDGSGSYSDVIKAIEFTVSHSKNKGGIKGNVASMSLGGNKSKAVNSAVNKAVDNGLVFVVAAGNEASDSCQTSPASAENAITVGASTIQDKEATFSNYGKCVTVYAPGKDILSAWIGSNKASNTISGTSMATPHVAGLAAYIMSLSSIKLSPEEVKNEILKAATRDILKLNKKSKNSPNLLIYNSFSE